jgi:hypothetical protein
MKKKRRLLDVGPFLGPLLFIRASIFNEAPNEAFSNKIGSIIVDTCCTPDTGVWETGVKRDGEWAIVEQYTSREIAMAGHNQWVHLLTENPNAVLHDIDLWSLDDIKED